MLLSSAFTSTNTNMCDDEAAKLPVEMLLASFNECMRPLLKWISYRWLELMRKSTWSDATVFALGTYTIHQSISAVFSIFYCILHSQKKLLQYRIQKFSPFDRTLVRLGVLDLLKRALISEFPVMLGLYYAFHYFGTEVRSPLPSAATITRDWIFCWCWTETTFYWSHRRK